MLHPSASDEFNDPSARNRPPLFFEMGNLPCEHYPDLHERQIEDRELLERRCAEANRAWANDREQRVEQHCARVDRHRRRQGRGGPLGKVTNGTKQTVWCVELERSFASLSEAARFVGRAPSNVLQAIRFCIRCGGYRWERFDSQRHSPLCPHRSEESEADEARVASDVDHVPAQLSSTTAATASPPSRRDWKAVARKIATESERSAEAQRAADAREVPRQQHPGEHASEARPCAGSA